METLPKVTVASYGKDDIIRIEYHNRIRYGLAHEVDKKWIGIAVMKKTSRIFFAMMIAVFLFSVFALPSASAAGATSVWVNNVELNAGSPYWKNGNLPATASDWNAHFDAATSTLTLNNAVIGTLHAYSSYNGLLFANGDLTLVLTGSSTLQYGATSLGTYMGIYVQGLLTVTGSGGASILLNGTAFSSYLYGIYTHDLAIEAGTLNIQVNCVFMSYGIASYGDAVISGGSVTVGCNGLMCNGVYAQTGDFIMTGGRIAVTAIAGGDAIALQAQGITLEGGEGVFAGNASKPVYGGYLIGNTLNVSGGHFVFCGIYGGLFCQSAPLAANLTNVLTYVSPSMDGSGKRLWTGPADGELASNFVAISPFRYVEFILPGTGEEYPRTGDTASPWLWAGIALCAALMAAGIPAAAARKKTR